MDKKEKIVISFPNFDKFGLNSELEDNNNIITLENSIINLIKKSTKTLDICSPFMEVGTIKQIIDLLIKKSYDGVNVRILVREMFTIDSKRIEDIKDLVRFIKRKKLDSNFEIRDYHYFKDNKVYSSIHAKFIISDNKYAYVGSGELRYNSIKKNLEIGVLIKGDKIITLNKIFENIWRTSKQLK